MQSTSCAPKDWARTRIALDLPAIQGKAWDIAVALCDVAAHVAPGFKIAFEPGMVGLGTDIDPQRLSQALLTLNECPASYHLADGRLLVAPFAAERKPPEFWRDVTRLLDAKGVKMAFLPVFLNPAKFAADFRDMSYGISYWGDGDVNSVESANSQNFHHSLATMWPVIMDPVRPQDVRPKSSIFWEAENTKLYRTMWETAINDGANYVQVITWNDLSESTEIEPGSAIQYVYYDFTAYYIDWFKTGSAPKIISDAIYYSSRSQITQLVQPPEGQQPMRLLGRTPVENNIEMVAFLTAPGLMKISIDGKVYEKEAKAGMSVFSVPASWGRPSFEVVRAGKTVAAVDAHYAIKHDPNREDPLYYGGSSNRRPADFPIDEAGSKK